jgi:hypothetical protein
MAKQVDLFFQFQPYVVSPKELRILFFKLLPNWKWKYGGEFSATVEDTHKWQILLI